MTRCAGLHALFSHTHTDSARAPLPRAGMIRIFPDFSVQVTAAAGGAAGGMTAASAVGRVPGAANGNPQNVQGLASYQQRYVYKHDSNTKKGFHLLSSALTSTRPTLILPTMSSSTRYCLIWQLQQSELFILCYWGLLVHLISRHYTSLIIHSPVNYTCCSSTKVRFHLQVFPN